MQRLSENCFMGATETWAETLFKSYFIFEVSNLGQGEFFFLVFSQILNWKWPIYTFYVLFKEKNNSLLCDFAVYGAGLGALPGT